MNLLIADDEIQIREGIKEGIPWGNYGIDNVFIAADGNEAYEIFMNENIDIIIADIRMPGIDGLELSKKIKSTGKIVRIIIISGFPDFQYAKRALQIGVVDYELKPVNAKKIAGLVVKAKKEIEEEILSSKNIEENMSLKKDLFIENLIKGNINDTDLIKQKFKEFLNFKCNDLIFSTIIKINRYNSISQKIPSSDVFYVKETALKTLEENLSDFEKVICNYQKSGFLIISTKNLKSGLLKMIEKSLFHINKHDPNEEDNRQVLSFSAGVSKSGDILSISTQINQCEKAYEFGLIYNSTEYITQFSDIESIDNHIPYFFTEEKPLVNHINNFYWDGITKTINEEFARIQNCKCYDIATIRNICQIFLNILIRTFEDDNIKVRDYIEKNAQFYNTDDYAETLEDFRLWILEKYESVFNHFYDIKEIKSNNTMMEALEYIKQNFAKDITLESTANHINKSPNYLSCLFKKNFKTTFSEYRNQVRINEAKNLIKNSDLMVYEIAEKVGFSDYKYFSKIFKKITGSPITKYKK